MNLDYWERKQAFSPIIDMALHLRLDHGMSWAGIHRRINFGRSEIWTMGFMRKLLNYRIGLLGDAG